MDAELTGRKVKMTRHLQEIADEGLGRIEKLVGRGASAHIILSAQKHGQIAEVTVNARHQTLVGLAEAPEIGVALRTALDKTEKQVLRWKKSIVEKKRQSKPLSATLPINPDETGSTAKAASATNGKARPSGLHIVPAPGAMAHEPMTIEEAVKEAEFRNQQVFVFRDPLGHIKVLHCAGDGLVRLIEVD